MSKALTMFAASAHAVLSVLGAVPLAIAQTAHDVFDVRGLHIGLPLNELLALKIEGFSIERGTNAVVFRDGEKTKCAEVKLDKSSRSESINVELCFLELERIDLRELATLVANRAGIEMAYGSRSGYNDNEYRSTVVFYFGTTKIGERIEVAQSSWIRSNWYSTTSGTSSPWLSVRKAEVPKF